MPGADRSRLLIILAFGVSFAAALFLSPFAPALVIALFIPVSGALFWLSHSAAERTHLERLGELVDLIEEPDPDERDESREFFVDRPFEALRERIESRIAWNAESIDRAVESGAMLRAYLNAIDTPVIALRESGRVAMMNRPARRLFARGTPEEGRTAIEDIVTSVEVLALYRRAADGEAAQRRVRLSLEPQARFYEVSAIPVRLNIADIPARVPPRTGVVLTFRDVHDLAQTLQLRTDFAANASHELRTPIASIKMAVETMLGPAADDPEMQSKLTSIIENNAVRLEETVNDLLDLSRLESDEHEIEIETFDASALCDSVIAGFEHVCERRRLLIESDISPDLVRMVSDRKLLVLVLRNLIDNATKFAFEGTVIRVTGEPIPSGDAGRRGARFRVIDQGVGIPLKHQERVFERFFQVDESRARIGGRRGSGLGLSIVRHALRSIDGEIEVESVWQEGTTMTITIPRCVEPGLDTSAADTPAGSQTPDGNDRDQPGSGA